MRASKETVFLLSFLLSTHPTIISALVLSDVSPFIPPFLEHHLDFITSANTSSSPELSSNNDILGKELRKRGSCPKNYNSCSTLAAADAGSCCTKTAVCSLDADSHVACCPTGAVCTGTIAVPTITSATTTTSTGAFVLGGSAASSTTFTSTSTTSSTSAGTTTFLTNSFFNFPRIASTYANSVACLSAFSACQTNFALCTGNLQGGAFGVTISAENGGTTVEASTGKFALGLASATSICSSLSSVACLNIQSTQCAQFGGATGTTTVGFVPGTNEARARGCGSGGYAMAAGVGLGIAGQLV